MQRLFTATGLGILLLAAFLIINQRPQAPGSDSEAKRSGQRTVQASSRGGDSDSRARKSARAGNLAKPQEKLLAFSGPEGWINNPFQEDAGQEISGWKFADGKFVSDSAASLAREIHLPRRSKLSIKLEWENSLRARVLFFADDGEGVQPDNALDLVIQRRFVYLRKRWMTPQSSGSRILGQCSSQILDNNQEAHLEFYFDRESGLIAFFLNGTPQATWFDADPGTGAFGDWLQVIAEDDHPLILSELEAVDWDGVLPNGENAKPTVEELRESADRSSPLEFTAPCL
jgi:hypothetical protein